ncbi:MAG: hypothetical protein B7733_00605 [Myxococcales bacterium FL481]|nr:MAG: hypothetical protein B7733_00605 [Myxococcales bacterium FL481]
MNEPTREHRLADGENPDGTTPRALPERVAGRYRLRGELGRGGFGVVYEAWDELNEQPVAIKFVRSDATMVPSGTSSRTYETDASSCSRRGSDSAARRSSTRNFSATRSSEDDLTEAFKDEFRLLTQLHHPNLAEVYEFGRSAEIEGVFFTQELVRGEHLTDYLSRATREMVVDIFLQLARALDYLHALGLVHDDIKPTNILVATSDDGPPRAKLIDFGLARVFRRADQDLDTEDPGSLMVLGAPGFSAPEKVRGERTDHRSDLYSLAATLYAAIRGQRAFPAKSFKEALRAQADWRPELAGALLPQAGPVVAELVGRMLEPDPEQRPQSARSVVLELLRRESLTTAPGYDRQSDLNEFAAVLVEHLAFVDRDGQLNTLLDRAAEILLSREASDSSQPGWTRTLPVQAIVVEAPEGMGKQRLMAELRREVQIGGGLFVEGTCWSANHTALGPFATVVTQLGTSLPDASPLRARYRSLLALARAEQTELDPAVAGELVEFLVDCAQQRPFVLHLAELARGQEFARFEQLARAITFNRAPILLCATTVPHSRLNPQLNNLVHEQVCETWRLRPLSLAEMETVVSGMLGSGPIVSELATMLDKLTGGHPLSFRETLRVMIEAQLLVREADRWRLHPNAASAAELHKTLAERTESRLDALGLPAWEIAGVLHLVAAPLDENQLASLSDLPHDGFRRTLSRLEGEGLVVRTTGSPTRQIALAHESVREAVRQRHAGSLDQTRLELATRILGLDTDDPNLLALRARLLDDAATGVESVDVLESTAHRLLAAGHPRLGAQLVLTLIDRLRRHGGVENLPRLLQAELTFLRDAAGALDDRDLEARRCEAGILIAQILADHRAESEFWLGLATRYTRYTGEPLDLELTRARLQKAADCARLAEDIELELIVSHRHAEVLLVAGQIEQAGQHSRRAMQILDLPTANDADVCEIIGTRLRYLAFSGQLEEAQRLLTLARPIAARVPVTRRLSYISGLTFVAIFSANPNLAIPEIESSIADLRKANVPRLLRAPLHNLGDLYLRLDDYPSAAEQFREAIRLATLYGVEHAVHFNRAFLGYTLARQGNLDDGAPLVRESVDAVRTRFTHDQVITQQLRLLDAEVAHMAGQSARARRELEEMLAQFHASNEVSLASWAQDALARIERDLGTNFIENVQGETSDSDPDDDTVRTKPVR